MRKLILLLATVGVITVVFGTIYVALQQNYRQNANDPQVQIAEDLSQIFESGAPPEQIVGPASSDLSKTLAPFVVVYGDDQKPIASSVVLDGQSPTLPTGVLDTAKSREYRVTWQPKDELRFATVIRHYAGDKPGFVLAGRSLREIEERIKQLSLFILAGWAVSVGIILVGFLLIRPKAVHKESPEKELAKEAIVP